MEKSFISRIFKKLPKVWILTFILSIAFFAIIAIPAPGSASQVHAGNPNSSGDLFVLHPDAKGQPEGAFASYANAGVHMWSGWPQVANSTASGQIQYQYTGGAGTYMADIGDTFYEQPAGSAIVWAQDQYQMAVGHNTFTTFAYNSNDTDLYYVSGFTALAPIVGLWNWSRNIVYSLFIIILIAVAFMILFRQQLGGQQYVTLTNSLPSIVISLVLVTFSYPISAVFIDLVSIGSNLVYNVMIVAPESPGYALTQPVGGKEVLVPKAVDQNLTVSGTPVAGFIFPTAAGGKGVESTELRKTLQPDDPQMSLWSIFYTSNAQVCGSINLGLDLVALTKTSGESCDFAKYTVPAAVHGAFAGTINSLLTVLEGVGVTNIFVELALVLMIITTQFKILKRLFTDYLILSYFPIISPWIFSIASLPNRTNKTIGDFIRILGSSSLNLIIIYACFLLLIIFGYATDSGTKIGTTSQTLVLGDSFKQASEIKWLPPMLGYSYGQIIGDGGATGNTKIVTTLVIIMFFMAIPRIPEEITAWLGVPELPPVLRGAGQDLAAKGKQSATTIIGGVGNIAKKRLGKS